MTTLNEATNTWSNNVCYRSTLWYYKECKGKEIREICNFAVGDLPVAKAQKCLIGNKFDMDVDISAIWCQVKEISDWTWNYDPKVLQNGV